MKSLRFVSLLVSLAGLAAAGAANTREIPIKLVAGKPCARCMLSGPAGSFPANVIIELGTNYPLVLHEKTANMLALDGDDTVVLALGDVTLRDLKPLAAALEQLETLSRDYASELDEIPAVAYLGLAGLGDALVELDLANERLRLLDPNEITLEKGETGESLELRKTRRVYGAEVELAYELRENSLWMMAEGPDGFPLDVRFSTTQRYTLLDEEMADFLGAPAGDVETLKLGRINVADIVALRPTDLSNSGSPPAQLVTGTDLLQPFRLTIEPRRQRLLFQQIAPASPPLAEREFYRLRRARDPNALANWVAKHAASRLAPEAAGLLLSLRMQTDPLPEALARQTLNLFAGSIPQNRRAAVMVLNSDEFLASGRQDAKLLARLALDIGADYARDDLNARAIHDIQTRRGVLALQAGDLREARRQLLSAAFGLPRDPQVNLRMGQLYAAMDKPVRAWSRYIQALLADGTLAAPKRGLDQLYRDPNFQAQFSPKDAEQLLEGRVPSFFPRERWERPADADADSGHLVELFASVDDNDTAAAELAARGLIEHFGDGPVAVLSYHLGAAQPDPLASPAAAARAAFYEIADTPVAIFDGVMPIERGGGAGDAPAVFADYQFAADLFDWGRDDWRLSGRFTTDDEQLHLTVAVQGPADAEHVRLFALLCEDAVLLPGGNEVFLHHHVVRHALTPVAGAPLTVAERDFEWKRPLSELRAAFEAQVAAQEAQHKVSFYMRPTYANARDLRAALFVQDVDSKQVLAALLLAPDADPTQKKLSEARP